MLPELDGPLCPGGTGSPPPPPLGVSPRPRGAAPAPPLPVSVAGAALCRQPGPGLPTFPSRRHAARGDPAWPGPAPRTAPCPVLPPPRPGRGGGGSARGRAAPLGRHPNRSLESRIPGGFSRTGTWFLQTRLPSPTEASPDPTQGLWDRPCLSPRPPGASPGRLSHLGAFARAVPHPSPCLRRRLPPPPGSLPSSSQPSHPGLSLPLSCSSPQPP